MAVASGEVPAEGTPPPTDTSDLPVPAASTPEVAAPAQALPPRDPELAAPPPINVAYLQYGIAFTAEIPSSAGAICENEKVPCVLGGGGGVSVRIGVRSAGAVYVGGVYELTKQDPNNLYRFATLQQARLEGRYYLGSARAANPYLTGALGVAGYGNEWSVDTFGPSASLGTGIELQVTRRAVVGLGLAYRVLYLSSFIDTSGASRAGGVTQLVGLDLLLEQRDPIVRSAHSDGPGR